MNVEFYTAQDASGIRRIAALAQTIWHEHYDRLIGKQQVDYMLTRFQSEEAISVSVSKGIVYRLILADGLPSGYYAAEDQGEKVFLSKLYLLASFRGRGISRKVLDNLCLAYPKCGAIFLTVNKGNEASIRAYRALGFTETRSVKTDIGGGYFMDDYIMEKKLRA